MTLEEGTLAILAAAQQTHVAGTVHEKEITGDTVKTVAYQSPCVFRGMRTELLYHCQ